MQQPIDFWERRVQLPPPGSPGSPQAPESRRRLFPPASMVGKALGRDLGVGQVLANMAVMMGAGGVLHLLRGEFPTSFKEIGSAMAGITIGAVAESLVEVLLASALRMKGITFTNVLNAPEIRGQAILGGLAYLGRGVISSFAGNIGNDALQFFTQTDGPLCRP